jgi:DisA bacterial checkpoint controller nucleotide-binding
MPFLWRCMSILRYFMWPWQHQFQDSAAQIAKRLLGPLDSGLGVEVFLVGFRVDESAEGREPICVSPKNCQFRPEIFRELLQITSQLSADGPTSKLPWWVLSHEVELCSELRKGLVQKLADTDKDSVFSACEPRRVNGYAVLIVAKVKRNQFEAHYRLKREYAQVGRHSYAVGRSLIETVLTSFLDTLGEKLQLPNPGEDIFLIRDDDAIYRAAAIKMMRGPAWAGGDFMGLPAIYEICNNISLQNYEGTEGAGRLAFVRSDHSSIKIDLKLRTPVSIHDIGAVRKLLQMGSDRLLLFCDSRNIYGLGTIGKYDGVAEDLFVVRFLRRYTWELVHAGNVMMYCREGNPQLRPSGPSVEPIRQVMRRVFPAGNIDKLVGVAMSVAGQPHGAMLVITPSAASEAVRLAKQAIIVEPFALTPNLIELVTAIDGAILVDLEGTCHAIGVILDGLASEKCTSARGARYNSGIRYAEQKTDRVVLVKSEDGIVNVLPEVG